jgi:hypothetical protein
VTVDPKTDRQEDERDREQRRQEGEQRPQADERPEGGERVEWRPPARQAGDGGRMGEPGGRPAPAATAERPAADEQLNVPEDREAAAAAERRAGGQRPSAVVERFELLPAEDLRGYRARWETLQASFVDDPSSATEQADALVGELVGRLTERHQALRDELRRRAGGGADTESRRQALRQYRAFFMALVGD